MTRTIALAVDGMEPELVSRWVESGELPHFRDVIERGTAGTASCDSLSSAKQWTTHFTGVSAERHGVTGFLRDGKSRRAGEDAPSERELINLQDIRSLTYPELLSDRDASVGLINPLPLWPPLELDGGFCISGMLTPPNADTWAFPRDLQHRLESSGYEIDVRYGDRPYGFVDDRLFAEVTMAELRRDMLEVLDARIAETRRAIREENVEYLYVLLKTVDIVQHAFWSHMENDDEAFGDAILTAYQRVDDLIGWVRESVDGNLVVFSDHGFGPRTSRPPDAVHRLAAWIGETVEVPSTVSRIYESIFFREREVTDRNPGRTTGIHADPAFVAMAGPDVLPVDDLAVAFEDVTPTILALLGEPIPEAYVGDPATDALEGDVEYVDVELAVDRRLDIDPGDVVSDRLHDLGYADMVDN
jgi:predicted AlkP superfamily phosphohydrolase/phosphomutase